MVRNKINSMILSIMIISALILGIVRLENPSAVEVKTSQEFSIEKRAAATVTTLAEFNSALADDTISVINVTAPINVTVDTTLVISRALTINGGNNLTFTRGATKTGEMILINAGTVGTPAAVSISGVKFVNTTDHPAVSTNGALNSQVVLNQNIITAGSLYNSETGIITAPTTVSANDNELLNNGKIKSTDTALTLGIPTIEENISTPKIKTGFDYKVVLTGLVEGSFQSAHGVFSIVNADGVEVKNETKNIPVDGIIDVNGLLPGFEYTVELSSVKIVADINGNFINKILEPVVKSPIIKTLSDESLAVESVGRSSVNFLAKGDPGATYVIEVLDSGKNIVDTQEVVLDSKGIGRVSISGLKSNTSYTTKFLLRGASTPIFEGTFRTIGSSIGGGTGSDIISYDITSADIRRSEILDIEARLYLNDELYSKLRRDNAKSFETNIKGIEASFINGELRIDGLVPGKEYEDLVVTYIDKFDNEKTIEISRFKASNNTNKLNLFVVNVYKFAMNRYADEEGFAYWTSQLELGKINPDEFVINLLSEKEFNRKYKTAEKKVEALYQVIVNRKADNEGKEFWINKFNNEIKKGYTEKQALLSIVSMMVNEKEFQDRVLDLGLN